jgi:ribosomal 50S subunit-associated protein YjgA (DUF615 family)
MTPENAPPEPDEVPSIHGQEDESVRSRTSLKNERVNNEKALASLVQDLLPLTQERWTELGVPEDTIATLIDARNVKSHGARQRHLRLIRATLRSADWSHVRRNLDRQRAGLGVGQAGPSDEALLWTERLLVQGDAGLNQFLQEFEQADRKRLRTLIRNVTSAADDRKGKARLALERAIGLTIERQAPRPDP